MGQTLTHGIYLPDEGERNCYNGLASNWSILDNSVGTVAEHTTQISGKAPLVHTHVKSDVTDLFNSANTWSGENKYTSGFILSNISWSGVTPPSSTKPTVIEFKNSDTRQGRYINRISSTSSETWIETIRNVDANTSYNHTVILKVDNSGNKSVYPSSNNDIDLGIAANQWNNLYAKRVNTQSVNGINPGSLSFPSGGTTENTDWYNVAGDILPTGGNATNFTGSSNYFTPSKDGWLALSVVSCESIAVWSSLNYGLSVVAPNANDNRQLIIPVVAGKLVEIKVKGTRWYSARLIVTQGNV